MQLYANIIIFFTICRWKLGNIRMPGVTDDEFSDENLTKYVRHFGGTSYHPCGTCKMGSTDDPTVVVDPNLRYVNIRRRLILRY